MNEGLSVDTGIDDCRVYGGLRNGFKYLLDIVLGGFFFCLCTR